MDVGYRHGKLVTIKQIQKFNRKKKLQSLWLCKCDCGNEKIISRSNLSGKGTRSCGCLEYKNKKKYHLQEDVEFVKKEIIKKIEVDEKNCWNWKGSLHKQGYGQFVYKRKNSLAHRVMYEITFGRIEKEQKVCHKCDNPSCCNPDHLFLGTQKDNVLDMIKKGRKKIGKVGFYIRKLLPKDIHEIRKLFNDGFSRKELMKKFKVGKTCIDKIVNKQSWKNLLEA